MALQKLMRLLLGSNPTVFEWLSSPIVYRESESFGRRAGLMDRGRDREANTEISSAACFEKIPWEELDEVFLSIVKGCS